ncbi:MAG: hypothetical protein MRY63_09705 [Neomegalonema sp.]|nr:hypothetical protein [Neomegalonema sp.]
MPATVTPSTVLPSFEYTVVLTSCARFDLLRPTVESFLRFADVPPTRFLIIEDSGDAAVEEAMDGLRAPFDFILNRPQLGQMAAIDRAYGTVTTPYIFHCEDDWTFLRSGFLAQSRALLDARPDVSMIGLRPRAELNPLVRGLPGAQLQDPQLGEIGYFAYDPALHPEYFSYSFNPGLRRLSDAQAHMPFAPLGGEEDVSYAFKKSGFRMANLEDPAVCHAGDARHVHDPTKPEKARTLSQRLARSVRKRVKRLRRSLSGE